MRRPLVIQALIIGIISVFVFTACSGGDDVLPAGSGNVEAPAGGPSETDETAPAAADAAGEQNKPGGVLLFGLGVHIEPFGSQVSSLVNGGDAADSPAAGSNGDYTSAPFFNRHVNDLETLAEIVERHAGIMTVQAQSPFTSEAVGRGETVLAELAASGHELGLHFHEDAHLGRDPEELSSDTWCSVMQEEISLIEQAGGVDDVRYWSGGNLYPRLLEAASCAGLDVNSDWKNPQEQTTAQELIGTSPWRPAGGSDGNDVSMFAAHDAQGPVIFLPNGRFSRTDFASARRSETAGGDQAYFDYLEESLLASLAESQADPGRVHVFHFTIHPGEFRGDPEHPFAVIDEFLTEVVDPLVASGQVSWATFSGMADEYAAWERAHPGQEPRGSDLP